MGSQSRLVRAVSRAVAGLLLCLAFVVSVPAAPVHAAVGGDLDLSFSGDGKAFDGLSGSYTGEDVALQEDGKLVVAGAISGDAAVLRFKPDGTLDTTFSGDGVVRTDFGTSATHIEAVAIQPDGKIVIVGRTAVPNEADGWSIAIARYTSSGSLDTTFRGDGKSNIDLGWDEEAHGVAIQSDGKIVVVGEDHVSFDDDFLVLRFTTLGALDSSFSGDGKVTTGFGGDNDGARDVAIQSDGKIVVAGRTDADGASEGDFAVARYTSGGSLDGSFNIDGKASTGFGVNDGGLSVAIQADGKVVVGGWSGTFPSRDFALARYTTAGFPDDSFDGDGKRTNGMGGDDLLQDLTIQPDGRIVAAGTVHYSADNKFGVARYNSGGSLNTSFGGNGIVITNLGRNDGAHGVVVQDDGKVVVAGTSFDSSDSEIALVRYHGTTDSPPDTIIDSGPSGTTSDNTPSFAFHATEAASKFECAIAAGSYAPCTSPKTWSSLADGSYTFRVRAYDSSAQPDPTPATRAFTVDTTPNTTITSGPFGPTNDATPTFTFSSSEAGSTFSCRVDADAYAPCTSPYTLPAQLDGPHTFFVRATDSDGTPHTDASPAERSFSVDTLPPDTVFDTGPVTGTTTDNTPTFEFHSTEAGSFRCSLDGAASSVCTSPKTLGPLTDGPHTFTVTAVDAVNNADPSAATASFAVDTMPPDTLITGSPNALTKDSTPTFSFDSTEPGSTFECSVDGAEFAPCASPYTSPVVLLDGNHSFAVRATDSTNNVDGSPAVHAFTVDTVPPNTAIISGPKGRTTRRTVKFTFSALDETAAGFQCRLDDRAWLSCSSPKYYRDLRLGDHVFRVRAFDAAGNRDLTPARREFRIVAG